MMPDRPDLVTYAASTATIDQALQARVDGLLLEHPAWSIACTQQDIDVDPITYLADLASYARDQGFTGRLILLADALWRDHQLPAVLDAVIAATWADELRAHDAGLLHRASQLRPELSRCQCGAWGNVHTAAVHAWRDHVQAGVQRLQLANDWDRASLAELRAESDLPCELLAHGPIVLQYSDRRQLAAWAYRDDPSADPDSLPPQQQALLVDGRHCRMSDSKHGMLLWGDQDRSLLAVWPSVLALGLAGVVIDTRQYDPQLASAVLQSYRLACDQGEAATHNLDSWRDRHPRPLNAGFFRANNTDAAFRQQIAARQRVPLGRVVDVIRHHDLVVELNYALPSQLSDTYQVTLPSGREAILHHNDATDLDGHSPPNWQPGSLVRWPWIKGIAGGCEVLCSGAPSSSSAVKNV